jgi:hypothetical protein
MTPDSKGKRLLQQQQLAAKQPVVVGKVVAFRIWCYIRTVERIPWCLASSYLVPEGHLVHGSLRLPNGSSAS